MTNAAAIIQALTDTVMADDDLNGALFECRNAIGQEDGGVASLVVRWRAG